MIAGSIYSLLALLAFINVNWAPTINTILLIVLALVNVYTAKRTADHRRDVQKMVPLVEEAAEQVAETHNQIEQGTLFIPIAVKGGQRAYDPPKDT